MGGLCFIFGVCLTVAVFLCLFSNQVWNIPKRTFLLVPLFVGLACAAIGFADDYGKVTSKSNRGLSAKMRLVAELVLGLGLGAALLTFPVLVYGTDLVLGVPLSREQALVPAPVADADKPPQTAAETTTKTGDAASTTIADSTKDSLENTHIKIADADRSIRRLLSYPLWVYGYFLILCPLVVAGTSNALNLHDGMDGLAGGTTTQVFACLSYMLWLDARAGFAMIAAAVSGALLAFLCYNRYRAKVFMGDTGSLFLGGLLAALAICGGLTFWLIPLGLIYIVEAFSVMAQVSYFKLTKPYTGEPMPPLKLVVTKLTKRLPGEGKRLFRMAPIHHHFEALYGEKGVKEWQVVACFWVAQAVLCAVTLWLYRR